MSCIRINHLFKQLAKFTFPFFLLKSEHDLVLLALVKSVFLLAILGLLIETSTQRQNSYSTAFSTHRVVRTSIPCKFLPLSFPPCPHVYPQPPGLWVIFHFSSIMCIEHLLCAGHCDGCWESTVTQAHLTYHPLGIYSLKVSHCLTWGPFQKTLPSLLPETYFLYYHCLWNHPWPSRYNRSPSFILSTSTTVMSCVVGSHSWASFCFLGHPPCSHLEFCYIVHPGPTADLLRVIGVIINLSVDS